MNYEQLYLAKVLKDAVENVYKEKRFLLQFKKGLEQAFVFRVGLYLNEILKNSKYCNLDLDVEFNKSIGASKMLEEFPKGIRPDLLLHERGNHYNNKLAVEFKGYWNKIDKKDIRKLVGLTSQAGDYKYTLGVFVNIGKTEPTFRYFINGVEHE